MKTWQVTLDGEKFQLNVDDSYPILDPPHTYYPVVIKHISSSLEKHDSSTESLTEPYADQMVVADTISFYRKLYGRPATEESLTVVQGPAQEPAQ